MHKRSVSQNKDPTGRRSPCPLSCTLDLLGDKWTLLVVRDLLMGKTTYSEILKSPEGIPTNILADRLQRLVQAGIIEKSRYQERPVRYAYVLTEKGKDLGNVLLAMVQWGTKHLPDTLSLEAIQGLMKKRPGG